MTLSAATLTGYFCRLHTKLTSAEAVFDVTWIETPIASRDQLQWTLKAFQLPNSPASNLSFDRLSDRFALLTPFDLKKIICALGAIKNQRHLPFCIDGLRLRQLQSMIGDVGYKEIMRPVNCVGSLKSRSEWSIESLCIDGVKELMSNTTDMHPITRRFIKVGLPKNISFVIPSGAERATGLPLPTLRVWYPELRWLFG